MLCVVNVQVKIPGLQSRFWHSAAAFHLSPGMTEVTIFGGCPEWPSNCKSDADLSQIADTTVLRFGEYISRLCVEVVPTLGPPLLEHCTVHVNSICPQSDKQ